MAGLTGMSWPDVSRGSLVLVPVGSVEQHGPHLPFDTDTTIAVAVADGVAAGFPGAVVTPPQAFGSSGEHQSFAGTASIGTEALRLVVVELVRSLTSWAGRIVLVNAHGGNVTALAGAVGQLRAEGHNVSWVACATEGVDLHAGITETSLMLHLRPAAVRLERAVPGNTRPLAEILPTLIREGVGAVSANGVLGDPTGATAVQGAEVLGDMVDDVVRRVRQDRVNERGMLLADDAGR